MYQAKNFMERTTKPEACYKADRVFRELDMLHRIS